jgi:prepilin-type N-terminal cleavage/methylation domain-containing protein
MPSAAVNPSLRPSEGGFSLPEIMVTILLLSVVLFTESQILTIVLVRSLNAMELARKEDQGARFVASIRLATKSATAWGIYSDLQAYAKGPEANLAPQGDVLVCDSSTQSGTSILYLFVYDPVSQTLKRFENNMNTERMILKNVLPEGEHVFNQNLGLLQGHWQMSCRNQLLTFSAYGTPPRMR